MSILQVRNLTKKFTAERAVVDHISFDLNKGETLGVLGVNGAGKTTTISMLTGLLMPTEGSIHYFGKNLARHRSEVLERVGTGSAYSKLPGTLTIEQNLDIFGRLFGLDKKTRAERIEYLLKKLDMFHMKNRRCGGLSAGETTRIVLAKAFIHDPEIVLLDEPTASLDIDIAKKIRHFINERRLRGSSVIITSHNMQEMTEVCDRIIVLHAGKIIKISTPEDLAKSVHKTRVQLMVGEQVSHCAEFAALHNIKNRVDGPFIELEVDEQDVAATLIKLATNGISYTEIAIRHPNLEDYFLELKAGL